MEEEDVGLGTEGVPRLDDPKEVAAAGALFGRGVDKNKRCVHVFVCEQEEGDASSSLTWVSSHVLRNSSAEAGITRDVCVSGYAAAWTWLIFSMVTGEKCDKYLWKLMPRSLPFLVWVGG